MPLHAFSSISYLGILWTRGQLGQLPISTRRPSADLLVNRCRNSLLREFDQGTAEGPIVGSLPETYSAEQLAWRRLAAGRGEPPVATGRSGLAADVVDWFRNRASSPAGWRRRGA